MSSECVFCNRQKNDIERTIYENDLFYNMPTLGQIPENGGHVLIVPKGHVDCLANLHDTKAGPMLALLERTREIMRKEYGQEIAMFEHGIVGQTVKHAHLHLFPGNGSDKITERVRRDFPLAEIDVLRHYDDLFDSYDSLPDESTPEPYLFWQTEDGIPRVCWNPPAPPQYFRIVLAEILGYPERANWRNMDRHLDDKLIAETIARLKPLFI